MSAFARICADLLVAGSDLCAYLAQVRLIGHKSAREDGHEPHTVPASVTVPAGASIFGIPVAFPEGENLL